VADNLKPDCASSIGANQHAKVLTSRRSLLLDATSAVSLQSMIKRVSSMRRWSGGVPSSEELATTRFKI
jgi:hypothetical protein